MNEAKSAKRRSRRTRAPKEDAEPTRLSSDREQALFESGIKLGGIFHQFIGVPVSERTSDILARAIEDAVSLQPFVKSIRVSIHPGRGGPAGKGRFGYRYLTAEMLTAKISVKVGRAQVDATLTFREDLDYPLMRVVSVA
jgi:hypothetical protein